MCLRAIGAGSRRLRGLARWITWATPEFATGLVAAPGGSQNHFLAASRALRWSWCKGWFQFHVRRCLAARLDRLHQLEKGRSVQELDWFSCGECLRFISEPARSHDNRFISPLGCHDAEHLLEHGSSDREHFPLLALDQRSASVLSQCQVHPTVAPFAKRVLYGEPSPTVGFGNQVLEVFPGSRAQGFKALLLVHEPPTLGA